jgi:hypothetical protein
MANKNGQNRIRQTGGEADADDTGAELRLEHLRRSFEEFRRRHRSGTRIPQTLRDQAMQVLRCGTSELQVRRACRISHTQMHWWRQGQRPCAQGTQLREHEARVFPVVYDVPAVAAEDTREHDAQQLQMRVGRWVISIDQDR